MNTATVFKKADSLLSVTLHKSTIGQDGTYYGKITRNTVTLDNIIAEIIEQNRGLDPYMIQHAAALIRQQTLKVLEQGKSVNVLDLGTLYIGMKGAVKGEQPSAADLPQFKVGFTPSQTVHDAVAKLQVDKIVQSDSAPRINTVTDLWTLQDGTLTAGKPARISGGRLKLGGNEYGIRFVPLDEDGYESKNESEWILVPESRIFKNMPKCLEFFVPSVLDIGKTYAVQVTTSLSGNTSLKTAVTALSGAVTVRAEDAE